MVDSIPSVPAETVILQDDDCCSVTLRSKYHRRNAKDGGISPAAVTLNTALTAADSHYSPRPFNSGNLYEDDGIPTAATADTKVLPHMVTDLYSRPCYLHNHHDHIRQDDDSSQDTFASSSHRQYNNTAVSPDNLGSMREFAIVQIVTMAIKVSPFMLQNHYRGVLPVIRIAAMTSCTCPPILPAMINITYCGMKRPLLHLL